MRKRNKGGGGPRTAAGKAIASRNALRHGFAAATYQPSTSPDRLERLARAIAGGDTDPAVISQAFKIATTEIMLSEIAAHKIWAVERLHERYAVALAQKNNSLNLMRARFMQSLVAEWTIKQRLPEILRKYEPTMPEEEIAKHCGPSDSLVPRRLLARLEEPEEPVRPTARSKSKSPDDVWADRDDHEAFEAAIEDLIRLDRYEQRAWSRQKRSILRLVYIKLQRWLQISPDGLNVV
jgi:hypothetical protein